MKTLCTLIHNKDSFIFRNILNGIIFSDCYTNYFCYRLTHKQLLIRIQVNILNNFNFFVNKRYILVGFKILRDTFCILKDVREDCGISNK